VAVDMHKPRLNSIFDIDNNQAGLSTYLINKNQFGEVVRTTRIENLSYVSSGPIPPNPAELLENGGFERFITEAKVAFDYVILDNPPVSIVTDGNITGRYSDTNLFLLRQGFSNKAQLKFIDQLGANETIQRVCIVLNDVQPQNYGYKHKDGNTGYYDDVRHPKGLERVVALIRKPFTKI
ncbi:MAG TPA: hypothetical protein VGK38_00035, partial [Prolixibacteraceae bacterium]